LLVPAIGAVTAPATASAPPSTTGPLVAIPAAGSRTASPETSVSFRAAARILAGDLASDVEVTGSESGRIVGTVGIHPDGRGLSFSPVEPFAPGETVTVDVPFAVVGTDGSGSYKFVVSTPPAEEGRVTEEEQPATDQPQPRVAVARTRPDLRAPQVRVDSAATGDVDAGLLFATPTASKVTDAGVLIYDSAGKVIYFKPSPHPHTIIGDASVKLLDGEPVLAWFEGVQPYGPGNYRGHYVIVDSTYREIARLGMRNGYEADIHDLVITPQGTALMMAYQPLVCDETMFTGCTSGQTVLDGVVQEIDIDTGTVLFEWHGLDHVSMADSYEVETEDPFDYLHLNSLDLDEDGNILLSARHTSALYKIHRTTGEVLFTFGARSNQFTYVDEGSNRARGPDFPHDFRARGDGVYSYFDNGVRRNDHSRGAVVALDAGTMTATYLTTITRDPPIFGPTQGRMQGLPNGNELIAWGGTGVVTEYTPDGEVAYEASLGVGTYRQVRYEWVGEPASPPNATLFGSPTSIRVAVSWNGDTRTASWRLLAGDNPRALSSVATVDRIGFETSIADTTGHRYLSVQALDIEGQPIAGGRSATLDTHR
jgi:hypothetical protein